MKTLLLLVLFSVSVHASDKTRYHHLDSDTVSTVKKDTTVPTVPTVQEYYYEYNYTYNDTQPKKSDCSKPIKPSKTGSKS